MYGYCCLSFPTRRPCPRLEVVQQKECVGTGTPQWNERVRSSKEVSIALEYLTGSSTYTSERVWNPQLVDLKMPVGCPAYNGRHDPRELIGVKYWKQFKV